MKRNTSTAIDATLIPDAARDEGHDDGSNERQDDGRVHSGAERHPWRRYVALGDSFTEGIGDPDDSRPGYHRGWADRVAEVLARTAGDEEFAYANLAVRGKLLDQIAADQAEPALALHPDLISVCAGGNDILRRADPDDVAVRLDALVGELASQGATILLFNATDVKDTPVLGRIRGKVAIYNENVRTIAARHDALVPDMWSLKVLSRPEMWAEDRLHFSPTGHHTIASMVLDTLNVEHGLDPFTPAPLPERTWRQARAEDAVWARTHLMPWVLRRLRGVSSGDGITAKRPTPEPLFGADMPHGSDPADS
ncbi:MAG: SGNH/GDSL hydrolase family protein [Micrococcus sp.]|nr:SGNH/GDSL hydrolase family protein [Micrococcus sp.]